MEEESHVDASIHWHSHPSHPFPSNPSIYPSTRLPTHLPTHSHTSIHLTIHSQINSLINNTFFSSKILPSTIMLLFAMTILSTMASCKINTAFCHISTLYHDSIFFISNVLCMQLYTTFCHGWFLPEHLFLPWQYPFLSRCYFLSYHCYLPRQNLCQWHVTYSKMLLSAVTLLSAMTKALPQWQFLL